MAIAGSLASDNLIAATVCV